MRIVGTAQEVTGCLRVANGELYNLNVGDTPVKPCNPHDSEVSLNGAEQTSGAVFTRWGASECPDETTLVYKGHAAGGHYSLEGGAPNSLCLTESPTMEPGGIFNRGPRGLLYGTGYRSGDTSVDKDNAPCAVCLDPKASTMIMLSGSQECPSNWTHQYHGFLMGSHYDYTQHEVVCVDSAFEGSGSTLRSREGQLWYPLTVDCRSLPCPPYEPDGEVTCSVCTH